MMIFVIPTDTPFYCFVIIMRSRRKEVNKIIFKAVEEVQELQGEDGLSKSIGIKPFQLTKIRQGQRSSFDLPHMNNQILHRRTGSNNLYTEEKDTYMNLIIQQKLMVDTQLNQKPENQRKNIFQMSSQSVQITHKKMKKSFNDSRELFEDESEQIFTQIEEPYCVQSDTVQPQANQRKLMDLEQKRNQGKCEICLQMNLSTNAFIRHKHSENEVVAQTQEREGSAEAPKTTEDTIQELKTRKQKALPPFSFTSIKWRSKSQILHVDKWKEKYGKEKYHTHKLQLSNKPASLNKFDKKSKETNQYNSLQDNKIILPILHKSKQLDVRMKIFKFSPTKREEQREAQKGQNPEGNSHPNYLQLTHENFKKQIRKIEEQRIKRERQEKKQIAIKKMYQAKEERQQSFPLAESSTIKEETSEEQPPQPPTVKQKHKRKKSKFPQIQITTFCSTKDQEDQKKRIRLENLQRLAREWRYNPPSKKVYMQKMMQEIPERWEYGESRDSSREVDKYIQHKQEEAQRQYFLREIEEIQAPKSEKENLCGSQIIVRQ